MFVLETYIILTEAYIFSLPADWSELFDISLSLIRSSSFNLLFSSLQLMNRCPDGAIEPSRLDKDPHIHLKC